MSWFAFVRLKLNTYLLTSSLFYFRLKTDLFNKISLQHKLSITADPPQTDLM